MDPRVERILNDLTSLIVSHAGMCAREQYSPSPDADSSDEYVQEHQEWVRELRDIRERLENLFTGVLPTEDPVMKAAKQLAREADMNAVMKGI